ncbi:MAG: discoidin domain-containing protein, partial [Pseudobdellovibrionaceae bacterium]
SDDNVNWTTIYNTTSGGGGIEDLSNLSGSGRYIRMYGTVRGSAWGYSLYEMTVYGFDPSLSRNRPVMVSSTQPADAKGTYDASFAVDGSASSRWSSALYVDPAWITVDLGSSKQINRIILNWENAYAQAYSIQISNDNATWTTIYSTTTGVGGTDNLTGFSVSGRYVRMYGTVRGSQWGYSLYEMNVYGP